METKHTMFIESDDIPCISNINPKSREYYEGTINDIQILYGIYGSILDNALRQQSEIKWRRMLRLTYKEKCTHDTAHTTETQSTCTENGIRKYICDHCGNVIRKEYIPLLPHPYVFTYNNDATCTTDGTETGICKTCGGRVDRVKLGSALGHDMHWVYNNDAGCDYDGTETGTCSRCGTTDVRTKPGSALGHNWGAWTVVTPATYDDPGVKSRECQRCHITETAEIPILTFDMQITTTTIDGMVKGTAYSKSLTSNAPVASEVVWSLSSGSLPAGLTLNSNGTISGTPTANGMFTYTIQAKFHKIWTTKTFTTNVANKLFTVTFNANGGSCSEKTRKVAEGSNIGALPTATRSGQTFGGWFTAATDGLKVDANYAVSSNVTLYARWGASSGIQFGDATTTFNIQYNGDRTNYNNNPYTLYHRLAGGAAGSTNVTIQTGISSTNKTSNMTSANKQVKLYLKVNNNGAAANFDIGFDCDSYCKGDDKVRLTRLSNGIKLGNTLFTVTVPYAHTCWLGQYGQRTSNRYNNVAVNTTCGTGTSNVVDSGYAFTINNIFINSGSYVILEITFKIP